ncbi:uncharacterized protein BX663DRAFT_516460 [Cokeromyces recurvatus]|uniref:uncharacterized protein n=1 Tax=Cokeromyces recurvatus TaxID=90255 RepID=UPI00221FA852|nr:uncharacterized protein BX663DRAFT_516460 [Cokeromyces recurvatus]KAI7900768.1 hypothetical protein BX663DRAFT_516460 [Cokeromyces recurvatus]
MESDSQTNNSITEQTLGTSSDNNIDQTTTENEQQELEVETNVAELPTNTTVNELRQRHVPNKDNTNVTLKATDNYKDDVNSNGGGFYECNICFDTAVHPVLTVCGHLFCWSCLAQWLNAQSRNPTCPVCKAGCGKDKVIPIYGRGKEEKDPRNDPSIPTRPAGQRPPPIRDPNRPATSFFGQPFTGGAFNRGGISISAGFGFFPLGVTFVNNNISNGNSQQQQTPQGAFMSRLIMMLLSLLVIAIIFA